jgi:hypothetical protein
MAFRSSAVMAPLALLSLVALGACATPQQRVSMKEDHLSAAGFVVRPADTPKRENMLRELPPHRFLMRSHGDHVNYVYADPLVCGCLYVGDQQAYNRYMSYLQEKHLADQQETTAQLYSDGAWNWGDWGPWGPGWEFRTGPGW